MANSAISDRGMAQSQQTGYGMGGQMQNQKMAMGGPQNIQMGIMGGSLGNMGNFSSQSQVNSMRSQL